MKIMTIASKLAGVLVLMTTSQVHDSIASADTEVGDPDSLVSALAQSHAGDRILVLAGTYELFEGL
jgi:hypothetical protein